jgi:hypothetical protein
VSAADRPSRVSRGRREASEKVKGEAQRGSKRHAAPDYLVMMANEAEELSEAQGRLSAINEVKRECKS